MDKSATFSGVLKDATALFDAATYRKALLKFETALTVAQNEESIIHARLCVINCYQRLEEVSFAELVGLGREDLTNFVLSASGGFASL